jgi:hypothetical protein
LSRATPAKISRRSELRNIHSQRFSHSQKSP